MRFLRRALVAGPRERGSRERFAGNAFVMGSRFSIGGISYEDGASIDMVADGVEPGTHPLLHWTEGVAIAYAPSDHDYSEGTYVYNQHYLNLEWIPEVGCVPNGTFGLGPFSVTIDRFETDEESGVEVVYGAFSGTLYFDNLAERLTSCTTPPNISASVGPTQPPLRRRQPSPPASGRC